MNRFALLSLFAASSAFAQASFPVQTAETVEQTLKRQTPTATVGAPAKDLSPEERERERLMKLPQVQVQVTNQPLRALVKYLAEQANMNYMSFPQGADGDHPVSISTFQNPFEVLQMLAEHYSIGMSFSKGVWHFYPVNKDELVARTYQIFHNTTEEFDSGGSSGGAAGQGLNQQNAAGANSSQGGAQAGVRIKSDQGKKLVSAIEAFLKQESTAPYATFLEDGSVGGFFPIPKPDLASAQQSRSAQSAAKAVGSVYFNGDTNQLYVLATRQQHEYIEGLLESVDRPQRLIAIEAKFIETSKDVSRTFGVDWSKVTGETNLSLSKLTTTVNLNDIAATQWPTQSILSASDVSVGVRALASDSRATTVQYPRVVTVNNRQVSLNSTVMRPVLKATTSTTGSGLAGSQTIQSVEEKRIGTIVDILPKILSGPDGENVLLNIIVSVSDITGQVTINGVAYPVTSERLFNYQVIVRSGYTLAVGGLEQTLDTTSTTKVPGLGDIPFFGMAFKKNEPTRANRTLMMLVTPTILKGYAGGLPDKPGSVISSVGNQPRPQFQGREDENINHVRRSLSNFRQEVDYLRQLAREARGGKADVTKADLLDNELSLMSLKVREELSIKSVPDAASIQATIQDYKREIAAIRRELSRSLSVSLVRP